jgi:hypothetical protein
MSNPFREALDQTFEPLAPIVPLDAETELVGVPPEPAEVHANAPVPRLDRTCSAMR